MITPAPAGTEPRPTSLKSRLVALLPLAFLLSAALAGAGLVVHQAAKLFAGSSPEEKWNLGDLGLCRAEGASCHVWDCCGVNGELKPMWCNPFASGQIGSIGKALLPSVGLLGFLRMTGLQEGTYWVSWLLAYSLVLSLHELLLDHLHLSIEAI